MATGYPLRAATIVPSVAFLEALRGPFDDRYAIALDRLVLFRWVPGSSLTIDHRTVLGFTGGTNGRWVQQRLVTSSVALGDASVSIGIGDGEWRTLTATTLTANRTITVNTTNASAGDMLTITRLDATAFTLAIVNGGIGAGTITTLPISQRWCVQLYFDGVNWSLRTAGQLP